MDDIKNMDVGEEEDGGWAGHHEEVDYSKEVVFSDSSDEEGSVKRSKSKTSSEGGSVLKSQEKESAEAKDEGMSRPKHITSDQEKWGAQEEEPPEPWGADPGMPHGRVGDRSTREREWRSHRQKERERRPPDNEFQRHEPAYHHSAQQPPGPYPPPHQYPPPNFPPYPPALYGPPPPFGPRGGHHYHQQQHMGSGNRYTHRGGGGGSSKRNHPEREDAWGENRAFKRKWDDKDAKPTILAKGDKKPPSPQEDKPSDSAEKNSESSRQQVADASSEVQESGAKSHVTFVDCVGDQEQSEQQAHPVRRGNQPKIMLRKLGDKDEGSERRDGRERPRDLKSRPHDLRNIDGDDLSGADSVTKTKTAWSVSERGPITSPKTLYEPEGKKSADKFKKYHHAQIQESHRPSKLEQEVGAEDSGEKVPTPTDRKEGTEKREFRKHETHKRQDSGKEASDTIKSHGYHSSERHEGDRRVQDYNHQSSRDKPHHRKEDSRRPSKGGVEKTSAARSETRQDHSERRQPKDGGGPHRDSQDSFRSGSRQQVEQKHVDQKPREDRGRRKDSSGSALPSTSKESEQHLDGGKGERRPHKDGRYDKEERRGDTRKHGDGSGREGKHNDTSNKDGRYGDGRYGDGRYGDGRYGDGSNKSSERAIANRKHDVPYEAKADTLPDRPEVDRNRGSRTSSKGGPKKGGTRQQERKQERNVKGRNERPPQRTEKGEQQSRTAGRSSKGYESRDAREGSGHDNARRKERSHPGLGYDELVDVSSPESELEGESQEPVTTVASKASDREMTGHQSVGGHGNKKPWRGKRGTDRKTEEEMEQEPSRQNMGRGRGKERRDREPRRPGGHHRQGAEEQRRKDRQQFVSGKDMISKVDTASTNSSESVIESSGSMQKFDVSKYDLNSHKVAIVDDIGSHGVEEGHLSPSSQAEFVEVTSKKTMKEKKMKEKEELQRKEEEKRLEEQKRKKKNTSTKLHASKDKAVSMSSTNKPYSAWSTSENKPESEVWSAAPGSQLKLNVAPTSTMWTVPSLPSSNYDIGRGAASTGSGAGRDSKAAMPHTAELVSSDTTDITPYVLFGTRLYSPFSSSVAPTSMLDAAVDSTIGTVTSPRAVTSHAPLIMDAPASNLPPTDPLPPVDTSLSETGSIKPPRPSLPSDSKVKDQVTTPGKMDIEEVQSQEQNSGGINAALPPRLKSGSGRGRGAGQRGDRRERKKARLERDQVGKSDREQIPKTEKPIPTNKVWWALFGMLCIRCALYRVSLMQQQQQPPSTSSSSTGRKTEDGRLYVHPRARDQVSTTSSGKGVKGNFESSRSATTHPSKLKGAGKGESAGGSGSNRSSQPQQQAPKVASAKKVSNRAGKATFRDKESNSSSSHHQYKDNRHQSRPRRDSKSHSVRENKHGHSSQELQTAPESAGDSFLSTSHDNSQTHHPLQ